MRRISLQYGKNTSYVDTKNFYNSGNFAAVFNDEVNMYSKVYVEITNICNLNCTFCHGHSRKPRMMSTNEFSYVLDKLSGKTEFIYYHLMGEPLVNPELATFIKMAKERGFKSIITTNGTLLEKKGDALIKSGVHKVSISVHSFEEGSAADFDRYMNEITTFAEKASKEGVIVVLRLWNKGYDNGLNDKVLSFLKENIHGEWAENTRGVRIHHKLHLEWGERFEWPDIDAATLGNNVYCYGLNDHFGILCDGTVVPCCMDSDGVINLGNIFKDDLDDILNSPRALAVKEGFEKRCASEKLCKKCGYARRFK